MHELASTSHTSVIMHLKLVSLIFAMQEKKEKKSKDKKKEKKDKKKVRTAEGVDR